MTRPPAPAPAGAGLFRLDGRTALVTGASSGLGARCAAVLHAAGAELVITARREHLLRRIAERLGDGVTVRAGDLTDPGFRASLVGFAAERLGGLDILVNNAGACDGGRLEDRPLAAVSDVLELDLVAPIDLCRLCAPLLFGRPGSTVINVASIFGLIASRAPMTGYNVAKGALVQFTRHLAAQWGERGVRVNALAPGFFPTELTGGLGEPAQRAGIERRTLLGRIPRLGEIDGPLLFLASDAASYVTGQILVVDGGWTAS